MSENANKKRNYAVAKIIVALCVVLCLVLTVFEMGLTYRTIKAVEVDGTEYSVAEYNWLYTNSVYEVYNNLYQSYGDLAQYFMNLQNPLDEQNYSDEQTWAEYIETYTKNSIIDLTALYNAGVEAGFELEQKYLDQIESEWEAMETVAKENGLSANGYAEMNYGRGVNEKVFKEMYNRYLYAMTYGEYVIENEKVTSEDMDAYYSKNSENIDSVAYNYYFASSSAEEGEDEETAKAEAKAEAEAVLAGTGEGELTEVKYAIVANINEEFADWLSDEARVSGDKEIFETETGYYVVEFVGVNDIHYNTVDVRHVLITPEEDTEEAKEKALEEAELCKKEWEDNGKTEEAFAEIAMSHSDDSSATVGGLYENVYKGQMVTEFEDWCFDSARKTGDCEIIETTYGYHVMYFVGEAESYYEYTTDNYIRSERYAEFMDSITEGFEAAELMGYKQVGKHFN